MSAHSWSNDCFQGARLECTNIVLQGLSARVSENKIITHWTFFYALNGASHGSYRFGLSFQSWVSFSMECFCFALFFFSVSFPWSCLSHFCFVMAPLVSFLRVHVSRLTDVTGRVGGPISEAVLPCLCLEGAPDRQMHGALRCSVLQPRVKFLETSSSVLIGYGPRRKCE